MRKMTMTFMALALTVAFSNGARAQTFSVGAFGGWNSATLDVNDNTFSRADRKSGFNAGGLVAWHVSDRFAVELAGMYTKKGSKVEDSGLQFDLNLDYIEIPLLARFDIPTQAGGRLSLHLFAGPAISFETSCKVNGEVSGLNVELDCDDPEVDAARYTTDYSLLFGGGVGIGAGPGDIQLDAAYDLGLTNLNNEPDDKTNIKNRTLMLTAGYILPIGGR